MNLDNRQSQPALGTLGKPGEAAVRFGELLSQDDWAVLGIGLNDFQPLIEQYGDTWRETVLEIVAKLLLAGRETCGDADDLLVRLTGETFLVITRARSAAAWEEKLRGAFREDVMSTFPPAHLQDGMICPSHDQRLPLPSLAIGSVIARDGPFSTPSDLLKKVTAARNRNQRQALLFELSSLTVTMNRLREEIQVAEYAPTLLPLIEQFTQVTTGPIHDLRNGLNILYEETRRMSQALSDATQAQTLVTATRYSVVLLETCSEIRFRGVGTPHKVSLPELLAENRPLWIQELDANITVAASPEPVEIYVDQTQIGWALFDLLSWLVSRERGCEEISVTCQGNVDHGEILITGDFDVTMDEQGLVERALAELGERRPDLYVFQKLVARYGGSVQFQSGSITLAFPRYQWQDVQSGDILAERTRSLRAQVEDLTAYLSRIQPSQDELAEDFSLGQIIGLGSQVIADLADEFGLIRRETEKQRREADDNLVALWESLEAGSRLCELLTANLLALEGEHVPLPRATDVASVLASVRRILSSKIESIAELEWNVEPDLPPVEATEATLAQVVMNLALNSLEELARTRPPVSRLGFAARQIQSAVQINISDTGGGLPTEVVEQLFKEPISTRQHVEGGIGLQVVKSILDELGGKIEFRSVVGEGTTASITLLVWRDQ